MSGREANALRLYSTLEDGALPARYRGHAGLFGQAVRAGYLGHHLIAVIVSFSYPRTAHCPQLTVFTFGAGAEPSSS